MASSPWLRVETTLVQGHQVASGWGANSPYPDSTIALQRPQFQQFGLDLSALFAGTLNLSIAPHRFTMVAPKFTFSQVTWTDRHPPEDFSFSPCRVITRSGMVNAWIYYPHPQTKTRHFQDQSVLEVIAPWIPAVSYGDQLGLDVDRREVEIRK